PADQMMRSLGKDASNASLAELYSGLIQGLVIDSADYHDAQAIEATGIKVAVMNTLMKTLQDKEKLIALTLHWATEQLKGEQSKSELSKTGALKNKPLNAELLNAEPIAMQSTGASAQKEVAL
ncbi:hypothetical protein ABMA58_20620, partial [Oceanospirillum sp. HFRX-1_2]